jgi:hypothetical protein
MVAHELDPDLDGGPLLEGRAAHLLGHAHDVRSIDDLARSACRPRREELAPHQGVGADQEGLDAQDPAGLDGPGHHHARPVVATHGVDGHAHAYD